MALLTLTDITTSFFMRTGTVRAVDGVSLDIHEGEVVGLVGESGCGKSVLCLSIMGLIPSPPGRVERGRALFDGTDLRTCSKEHLRSVRGNRIGMVFQDSMTSLNPYLRIGTQLIEPLRLHRGMKRGAALDRAAAMLGEVGIGDAASRLGAYPHEFSGGMRQRVMIAMALLTRPSLLIADEPTTALDVTVQAQILALLERMQERYGMAVLFITHDMGIVARFCDRVLVMYAGRIVESASARDLFGRTRHPYTEALIRSLPSAHAAGEELSVIPGMPPDLSGQMIGCPFAPRCRYKAEPCMLGRVELGVVGEGHMTACTRVLNGEISL